MRDSSKKLVFVMLSAGLGMLRGAANETGKGKGSQMTASASPPAASTPTSVASSGNVWAISTLFSMMTAVKTSPKAVGKQAVIGLTIGLIIVVLSNFLNSQALKKKDELELENQKLKSQNKNSQQLLAMSEKELVQSKEEHVKAVEEKKQLMEKNSKLATAVKKQQTSDARPEQSYQRQSRRTHTKPSDSRPSDSRRVASIPNPDTMKQRFLPGLDIREQLGLEDVASMDSSVTSTAAANVFGV